MGVAVTELWAVGELDLVDDLVFTETISRFLFTTGGNLGFVFVFLSLTVVFVVILTVSTFLAAFSDNFFWCRKRVTFCSSCATTPTGPELKDAEPPRSAGVDGLTSLPIRKLIVGIGESLPVALGLVVDSLCLLSSPWLTGLP